MDSFNQVASRPDMPALESEKDENWIEAFLKTIHQMAFHPSLFFKAVGEGRAIKRPLIFSLVVFYIMVMATAAYQLGFQFFSSAAPADAIAGMLGLPLGIIFFVIFLVIGVPALCLSTNLIKAGMYHICLAILGAASRDFTATFRVVCYSSGIQVLQVVPVLGSIAGYVWGIVLDVIGLREAHGTTTGKSLLAVFLPMLLCCGFLVFIVSLIVGGVFAAALKGW